MAPRGLVLAWAEESKRIERRDPHHHTDMLSGGMITKCQALLATHRAATARWMARASADLVGLSRKGRIDVDASDLHHRHPFTPYAGRTLRGAVVRTWLRSEVVDFSAPPGPPARRGGPGGSRAVEQESMTIQQRVIDAALQPRRS
jgi:hypothetical protein